MKSKVVSWFFIIMMFSGLLLIFSPNSVVVALGVTTVENWDGYNVGVGSGTNTYFTWSGGNDYVIANRPIRSNYNSLRGDAVDGDAHIAYMNFTEIFDYTSEIQFYIDLEFTTFIVTDNVDWKFFMKEGDENRTIVNFSLRVVSGSVKGWFSYQDIDDDWNGVYSENIVADGGNGNFNGSFVITHTTANLYSYAWYNENATLMNTVVDTGRQITTHTTFDQIMLRQASGGVNVLNLFLDDIILTDTIPGNTTINVYNETSPSTAIPDWNLRIYDDNNAIQYSKNNLDNPISINHTEYGLDDMFFEISATGYYNRTYYADIKTGVYYLLNAFLLATANPDAHVYTCIVVDDSDLDHIIYINDATITITRFINGSIHEISSGFTDGSGRFYVPLIAGVTYTVNITATGYDDLQDTYIPSSSVFEHTFHMATSSPTSTTYDDFWENISIDISMVSAGCMQDGNITITYLDSNSSTTNTEIRLWEIYGPNNTLLNTWSNTSNSFFNINSSINTTRVHYMSLYFNNTAFFMVSQPMNIMIPNVDSPFCDRVEPFDLDDRITKIVGPFTIDGKEVPWTVVIGSIIPVIFLVAFGPFNTGLGIICCGVSMSMLQSFLHMYVTGGFQWGILGIGAFITILGILYIMTKGTGGDHL